ncbi:MAG: hypothetical protein CVU09_01505 [Bacteroidetes bacterium HGW-Bacteroidetes-4]|jgi:hypothetical protein|nr:MAG: hypothetical protein CVU09_01505 [Bacteroidetes bacterium HGW-Bacteroidetes-4]
MVKVHLIIILFVSSIFITCQSNKENNTIIGEWFFVVEEEDTVYNEVFISNEHFVYYLDMQGFMPKQTYRMSADSIIFSYTSNEGSVDIGYNPILEVVGEDEFKLQYKGRTLIFRRLQDTVFTIDSIRNESDINLFEYHFYKRRNKYFFNLGYEVDTIINEVLIEEETIEPTI